MKRLLILILLPLMLAADQPKKATPPQAIVDALAKVAKDQADSDVASAAAKIAEDARITAVAQKATADAAKATDYALFLQLVADSYGPVVPPTPPTPVPVPTPTPPTPVPVPVPVVPTKLRTAIFYDTSGAATESQREMRTATAAGSLRAWLQANSLAATDGTTEMRFWPAGMTATDVATSASRWVPLVEAAGGKIAIVAQAGEGGPVKVLDFPPDTATAIAALNKIANPAGRLVISDANWRQFVNLPDHGTGYIKSTRPNTLPKFRSVYPLIPRSQWPALIKEGQGSFLSDVIKHAGVKVKNQGKLNYCWAFASTECVEAIRALQGQPYVELSPESVGGPVVSWRNVGGNGLDALDQLTKVGACAASFLDQPLSLNSRRWATGWQADTANHKTVAAWAELDSGGFDAVMTAALLRLPVSIGLDYWEHQIEVCDPVQFTDGSFGTLCRNSWGDWPNAGDDGWFTLTESKCQPDGSFAAVSVGTSDRELNEQTRGTVMDLVALRQQSVRRVLDQKPAIVAPAVAQPVPPCNCPNGNCPT